MVLIIFILVFIFHVLFYWAVVSSAPGAAVFLGLLYNLYVWNFSGDKVFLCNEKIMNFDYEGFILRQGFYFLSFYLWLLSGFLVQFCFFSQTNW